MQNNAKQPIVNNHITIFIFLSVVIFFIGVLFVAINTYSNNRSLERALQRHSEELHSAYDMTMELTYRSMMQLAIYISNDPDIARLFRKGKEAVEAEGGGKGGTQSQLYRQALLDHLSPSWERLTRDHDVRQLHFHLAPGSLSYLRVHKPEKYGDRMDDVRFSIVDTNAEQTPRTGFEIGRGCSGIRAITPFFDKDTDSGEPEHIGALEVGTSFSSIMHLFRDGLETDLVAVLLHPEHVERAMWPGAIKRHFPGGEKLNNYYIESISEPKLSGLLTSAALPQTLQGMKSRIIRHNRDYYSLTLIPLRDYRNDKPGGKTAGLILMADNINDEINANTNSLHYNLMLALVSFIVIEVLIFMAIRFATRKLQNTIDMKVAHIEELNSYLAEQAITDSLTRLHNHRFFIERLGEEMSKSLRNSRPLCLIMLDIDHFKQVNDTHGHQAGDRVLEALSDVLKAQMRTGDEVGRYGGEEFSIALTNTSLDEALIMANRLMSTIRELRVAIPSGDVVHITVSMGLAQWDGVENMQLLIERADQALFAAKNSGRNCIEVAQQS